MSAASETPAPPSAPLLMVVDDDERFRERMARALRERGYEVMTADGYASAVALAEQQSPEYAVVDLRMPGKGGLELVRALRAVDANTRIVVLTGYGSIATALEAVRLGAVHYLTKPATAEDVLAALLRGSADAPAADAAPPPDGAEPEVPSLARAEWEHIERVLADCGGNISEAARKLGIHRRSLQRKLQRPPTF
ncbi:response regulator [Aggregicoccus sp. 17bor-14]|uniref:response regulator transcription factor n=1 Tax=Myxococcaceae TaxID=31 RepID=UPI00129D0858|nr:MULTISPECIES: response regulator [Myxococcaceae]MBF5041926.1 response regulator [Simulacricoccus sp. 17bor-14]MRI87707.1 response regulator [Aggregicoccus sp. 17bor-14]